MKIEISRLKIKPVIATLGASVFACVLAVPAFALPTTPVSSPSTAGIISAHGRYDHTAPLAGQQFAEEGYGERDYDVHPYGDDDTNEHLRHEEMKQEGREELHHMREKAEEHADRAKARIDEERAEHERHEAEEHGGYGYGDESR